MDWETGAITATDDLSFGALDVGDARFPAFDLGCSDMDTQVMVYSSHASTGTIGNPSLEGVWVPHGAWGGRAELHKLDSSGRILQFPLWSYDKNCNPWELCERQLRIRGITTGTHRLYPEPSRSPGRPARWRVACQTPTTRSWWIQSPLYYTYIPRSSRCPQDPLHSRPF